MICVTFCRYTFSFSVSKCFSFSLFASAFYLFPSSRHLANFSKVYECIFSQYAAFFLACSTWHFQWSISFCNESLSFLYVLETWSNLTVPIFAHIFLFSSCKSFTSLFTIAYSFVTFQSLKYCILARLSDFPPLFEVVYFHVSSFFFLPQTPIGRSLSMVVL